MENFELKKKLIFLFICYINFLNDFFMNTNWSNWIGSDNLNAYYKRWFFFQTFNFFSEHKIQNDDYNHLIIAIDSYIALKIKTDDYSYLHEKIIEILNEI